MFVCIILNPSALIEKQGKYVKRPVFTLIT